MDWSDAKADNTKRDIPKRAMDEKREGVGMSSSSGTETTEREASIAPPPKLPFRR
jgi:hypothetical protein